MYQSGGTIHRLLTRVAAGDYLLPAIQREFVWEPAQVCKLFDSLMQGYPFGTFLFWKIQPQNSSQYQFYDFLQHYHERDGFLCHRRENPPDRPFIAVLDGQQRITALNIGLRGSYAEKLRNKRWKNNDAFPRKRLHLNLLGGPDPETGTQFQFEFLTDEAAAEVGPESLWFPVPKLFGVGDKGLDELVDALDDHGLKKEDLKRARVVLRMLYRTLHDKELVTYFEEEEQSLEKVLNIFIRLNSGGTPLSYSDLLLSIAVTQWQNLDAREEIRSLVKEMNETGSGFSFSKDLVLKAGLMLSDIGSVGFKVENFNKDNMDRLEANWQGIRESLLLAVRLLAEFGFSDQTLSADSPLLPIAYYLHHRKLDEKYLTLAKYASDREAIRDWLLRSLLKASGIWGSGLDTLLTGLRAVIQEAGRERFPKHEIERYMTTRGKSLEFSEEEILDLAELEYGHRLTFPLLSMLFPGHDPAREIHVDHVFPIGRFRKAEMKRHGVDEGRFEEFVQRANRLPNLQLLVGTLNNEKRKRMPHEWIAQLHPSKKAQQAYLGSHAIPFLPESLAEFSDFYDQRRGVLEHLIRRSLNPEYSGPRG